MLKRIFTAFWLAVFVSPALAGGGREGAGFDPNAFASGGGSISDGVAQQDAENENSAGGGDPAVEAGLKEAQKTAAKKAAMKAVGKTAGNNPIGIFFKTLLASKPAY